MVTLRQVWGWSGNLCKMLPLGRAAALPSGTLQVPLLSNILLAFLIWHFPCCFWDQSKHILNVHLYDSVPVVLHMPLGSLMAVTLKVFSSSTKLVGTSWELLKGLMNAYLHVQAPKILSQSGPCFGHLLLHTSSWLMTVNKQDSNQVLSCRQPDCGIKGQSFSTGPVFFCIWDFSTCYILSFLILSLDKFVISTTEQIKRTTWRHPQWHVLRLPEGAAWYPSNPYQHQVRGCNAVIWVDRRENKLSAELVQQTSSISHFPPWCGKPCDGGCENGLQEHNLQLPVSKNRGKSSGGKHSTDQVQKYFISRAYTAGLPTSSIRGSHQRRRNHGQIGHCTDLVSLDSHPSPTCPEHARLAASVLSTASGYRDGEFSHFNIVALKAYWRFVRQPSCRFMLSSYRQHRSRGKGGFQDALVPASIPQCHSLLGTIAAWNDHCSCKTRTLLSLAET